MIDERLHVVKDKELILLAKKCFKCFDHTSFLESLYLYQTKIHVENLVFVTNLQQKNCLN